MTDLERFDRCLAEYVNERLSLPRLAKVAGIAHTTLYRHLCKRNTMAPRQRAKVLEGMHLIVMGLPLDSSKRVA